MFAGTRNAGTAATSGSAGWDRGSWSRRNSFAGSRDTNRFRLSSKNWKLWRRLSRGLSNGERRRRVGYAGVATFNGVPGILSRIADGDHRILLAGTVELRGSAGVLLADPHTDDLGMDQCRFASLRSPWTENTPDPGALFSG